MTTKLKGASSSGEKVVMLGKKMCVKETIVEEMDMKVPQIVLNHFLSARRLYPWKNLSGKIDLRPEICGMSEYESCSKERLEMKQKQIRI